MSHRCYCCKKTPTCDIFKDTFDADDLSASWTIGSGTWSISGSSLRTSSSNARIICNTTFPDPVGDYLVKATCVAAAYQYHRIIVNYTSGSSYTYVEIYWNGASSRVFIKTSGGSTLASKYFTATAGNSYDVWVCVTDSRILVNIGLYGEVCQLLAANSALIGAVGLGSGTLGSEIQFTSFTFERRATARSECEWCRADCGGGWCWEPADEVLVEFGAYTLADSGCNYCNELFAPIVLSIKAGPCDWEYDWNNEYGAVCTYNSHDCWMRMLLQVLNMTTGYQYRLQVVLDCPGSYPSIKADYLSAILSVDDVPCELPIALNLDTSESHTWTGLCTGAVSTLPQTATLSKA
jgi:hypothetical protein